MGALNKETTPHSDLKDIRRWTATEWMLSRRNVGGIVIAAKAYAMYLIGMRAETAGLVHALATSPGYIGFTLIWIVRRGNCVFVVFLELDVFTPTVFTLSSPQRLG